jgi:hypothetical protein
LLSASDALRAIQGITSIVLLTGMTDATESKAKGVYVAVRSKCRSVGAHLAIALL